MKFSVVVTEAYSSHIRAAWPLPVTRKTISCPAWPTSAPNARNTATCGSISRAPSVQPLTSCSSRASPRRTSSPGIIMIEARIAWGSVALALGEIVEWSISRRLSVLSQFTVEPSSPKNSTMRLTSVISGTLRSVIGPSLSRVPQSTGRTAFLLADGSTLPVRGLPPRTRSAVNSVSHQLEDFLPALLVAAEHPHDPAGDHVDPGSAHPARGHARMARLDHYGDALGLELVPDALRDLGREPLLDLKPAGKTVQH